MYNNNNNNNPLVVLSLFSVNPSLQDLTVTHTSPAVSTSESTFCFPELFTTLWHFSHFTLLAPVLADIWCISDLVKHVVDSIKMLNVNPGSYLNEPGIIKSHLHEQIRERETEIISKIDITMNQSPIVHKEAEKQGNANFAMLFPEWLMVFSKFCWILLESVNGFLSLEQPSFQFLSYHLTVK